MLALLPVAQAIGAVVDTADGGKAGHEMAVMDCGQVDPNHCIDYDNCASGSHNSCDSKTKTSLSVPVTINSSSRSIYAALSSERYSSHHAERLLRPPRNA